MLPQVLAQQVHDAALVAPHGRAIVDGQVLAACGNHGSRLGAKEGIAANLFTALNRFQQEGILLPDSDTEKRSHRRKQIRTQRFRHRDKGGVAAELQKAFEVRCKHRRLSAATKFTGIIRETP